MYKPQCPAAAPAWKTQLSAPTLPKAPWQMSVRVAPPAMNWGLEHSSWEQNKPCITRSRSQGREQGPTCSKLTKPLATADERHRDGAGQERVRAPDTPSTVRTGAGDQSSCAAISLHRTCREVHCIFTHVHTPLCHYLPTTDYAKVFQKCLEAPRSPPDPTAPMAGRAASGINCTAVNSWLC